MYNLIASLIITIFLNFSFAQDCDGDANSDLTVNVLDVVVIVSHVLEENQLIDDAFDNADYNDDSVVDVLDIVAIVNLILIGESECEESNLPLDLSLAWETEDDLSYFDNESLQNIMIELDNLSSLYGIVIIHRGKIIEEEYYGPGGIDVEYNIFSVTKSYIATLIGQAIDLEYIPNNTDVTLNNLLNYDQQHLSNITLKNVLTMSTGYSDLYGYPVWVQQSTENLVNMPYGSPNSFFYNNSACHLNSHILYYATEQTPIEFAQENLFPYLGIENPSWLSGYNGINDGSASLELTLREMVKLGQLYIQDGYSGDQMILSSEFIEEATTFQIDAGSGFGYGYLWWLPPSNEEVYMAIGYGGQLIVVIPERNLVIGTHSYTFSSGTYQYQLRDYIINSIAPLFDY